MRLYLWRAASACKLLQSVALLQFLEQPQQMNAENLAESLAFSSERIIKADLIVRSRTGFVAVCKNRAIVERSRFRTREVSPTDSLCSPIALFLQPRKGEESGEASDRPIVTSRPQPAALSATWRKKRNDGDGEFKIARRKFGICVIPPPECWGPFQILRREHDRHYGRWVPHINVVHPLYLSEEELAALPEILNLALLPAQRFRIHMNSFDYFKHPVSCLLFARPCAGHDELRQLQWTLSQIFYKPEYFQQTGKNSTIDADDDSLSEVMWGREYTPHLCLGQWRAEDELLAVKAKLERTWSPVEWLVDRIYLVESNAETTSVRFSVGLGGGTATTTQNPKAYETETDYRISRWQRRCFVQYSETAQSASTAASAASGQSSEGGRLLRPDRARLLRLARMLNSATKLRTNLGPGAEAVSVRSRLCWLVLSLSCPCPGSAGGQRAADGCCLQVRVRSRLRWLRNAAPPSAPDTPPALSASTSRLPPNARPGQPPAAVPLDTQLGARGRDGRAAAAGRGGGVAAGDVGRGWADLVGADWRGEAAQGRLVRGAATASWGQVTRRGARRTGARPWSESPGGPGGEGPQRLIDGPGKMYK